MMSETEIKELVQNLAPTRTIYTNLLEMSEELTDVIIQLETLPTFNIKINYDQYIAIIRGFKSQVFDAQTAQKRGIWGTDLGGAEICMKTSIERAKSFLVEWTAQSEEHDANRGKSISEEEIIKLAQELDVDPNSEEFQDWIKAVY